MRDYREILKELQFWKKDKTHLIEEVMNYANETNNLNIVLELAETLMGLDKYNEARRCLIQVQDEGKENPVWNYLMGVCMFMFYKETNHIDDLQISLKYLLTSAELGNTEADEYLEKNLKQTVIDTLGEDAWPKSY